MPSFRGLRVTRGHAPMGGTPKPPLPNPGRESSDRIRQAGPPPRPRGSSSSAPAPRGPQVNAQTEHNLAMDTDSRSISDAQSVMRTSSKGSDAYRKADLSAMESRRKMDERQKEWDSPMSVMKRAKAPKNG